MNDERPTRLSKEELSIIALEGDVLLAFIARMVREHKASLVSYIELCQNYIDEYKGNIGGEIYWRAELVEAMRQLELSDSELLAFIKPDPPHRLVKVKL